MQRKNSRKKTVIFIVIIIVIAAVIAGVCLVQRIQNQNSQAAQGIVLDEDAEDWNGETEDLSEGQQGIKIPGYGEIAVSAGTADWQITLANPEDNNCYFKYTITIDDSEVPIYESDLIEPGKAVREFEVTEPLEAGEYEIHLNVSTYAMDDELTPMNGAVVKAELHVV